MLSSEINGRQIISFIKINQLYHRDLFEWLLFFILYYLLLLLNIAIDLFGGAINLLLGLFKLNNDINVEETGIGDGFKFNLIWVFILLPFEIEDEDDDDDDSSVVIVDDVSEWTDVIISLFVLIVVDDFKSNK